MEAEMKDAIENLGRTHNEFVKANDKRLDEVEKNGKASAALEEKVAKLSDALDAAVEAKGKLEERIENNELALQRSAKGTGGEGEEAKTKAMNEYKTAYNGFLRKGDEVGLRELEAKALSVGIDPDGGYTVTPEISAEILRNITETTPMRQLASVISIGTDAYEQPKRTGGTANGGWVGELDARPATNGPTRGMLRIPTHEQYAMPEASQKLLDDSNVNIEQWLSDEIREVFGTAENTSFVTGDGVNQPRGILTFDAGTSDGQIEQVVSGHATLIQADGLINLQDALLEGYQANATWLMNRTTTTDIRQLKDATNEQYLWQPGLQAGEPDTLLGKPIVKGSDMPAIGASALAICYGDFRRAYKIVDRMGIRVLRDPYSSKPLIQFYATKRVGGDVVLHEALKIQKISA